MSGLFSRKHQELSNGLSLKNKDESELRAVWGADYNNIAEEVREHQECLNGPNAHRCY